LRGIETVEDLARVKRVLVQAVAPSGTAVLNAADPLVAGLASCCPGSVLFFSRDPLLPVLVAHRQGGGRWATVRDGTVVLGVGEGEQEVVVGPLAGIRLTHGGRVGFQVDNVLAAAAAAWSLGLPPEVIRTGLESFTGEPRQLPGRFNVLPFGQGTVIVDYAH